MKQTSLNDKFNNELKIGDLVLVAYTNNLIIGIFAGVGQANNLQYYPLTKWNLERVNDGKRLYKSYINTSYNCRFAKYSVDLLNARSKFYYETILKAL
jgi:hypothetical protein